MSGWTWSSGSKDHSPSSPRRGSDGEEDVRRDRYLRDLHALACGPGLTPPGKRLGHRGAVMPSCLAVDFYRRRPSPQTLAWVERVTAARVVAWRRMTGGDGSVVHRLTIVHRNYRNVLVLRQYEDADSDMASMIRHEVETLRAVHNAGLPTPEAVAADADGLEADRRPALLMTRLPGRLDLTPADSESSLRQTAAIAARIHAARVAAAPGS